MMLDVVTLDALYFLFAFLAGLATSILSIWALFSKVKKSVKDMAKEEIDKHVDEEREERSKDREAMMNEVIKELTLLREDVKKDNEEINKKLDIYIEDRKKKDKRDEETDQLLKDSLIEAYKREIRNIYYKLRQTGELTDIDMAYVEKIYPKYKKLGGNSDISAKYKVMREIYDKITKENFEVARKNKKEYSSDSEEVIPE